jgi:hypothetical protein
MNEEEFDALMKSRPFGTEDLARWETELHASTSLVGTLGVALWGKTFGDAQRQVLASHPEIAAGFDLPDFRTLLQWTAKMASAVSALQRMRGLPSSIPPAPKVFGGSQGHLTLWEARCEIVRRAIEYLEKR